MGASTSHNSMGLHCLLQGQLYHHPSFFYPLLLPYLITSSLSFFIPMFLGFILPLLPLPYCPISISPSSFICLLQLQLTSGAEEALGNLHVTERIILKWIFKEYGFKRCDWSQFAQYRRDLIEHLISRFMKAEGFLPVQKLWTLQGCDSV
jgi:hypothetical protein